MSVEDMRKLSAQIEAMRPALDEAYKRLDARWSEVVETLKSLPIPTDVSFTYHEPPNSGDSSCLVWHKFGGKRRICIEHNIFNPNNGDPESDWEVITVPYEEWSGSQRIEMLKHVPGLFKAALDATRKFIDKANV